MKKKIRFRAWDGTQFYYFANHAYTLSYNDIAGWNVHPNIPDYKGEWTTGESSRSAESFDLQQFTGLKDKNGRDIYEGDIVRRGYFALNDVSKFGPEPWRHLPRGINESNITTVIETWVVGVDITDWQKLGDAVLSNPDVLGVEIIGNVYENPELVPE